ARMAVANVSCVCAQIAETRRIARGIASAQNAGNRNRRLVRDTIVLISSLVITEEEELVLDDRAANRSTILLPVSGREGLSGQLRKRIACRLCIVAPIIKARAMEFIRAGLNLYTN